MDYYFILCDIMSRILLNSDDLAADFDYSKRSFLIMVSNLMFLCLWISASNFYTIVGLQDFLIVMT